ncbi:glycerol kinase 1 [Iodidimonas muriae]|uniref:Glycerol kinase n=2 Tax=Iodidimonas muriae TaxID=261467 RepID=A0ABQ2LC82_9PROT|nr:glycerol kinase 1 [Kordiimonadales bacterium JCM 17843]GGO10237.1 glycerol kinase 1 [Iodidimonas muriae]
MGVGCSHKAYIQDKKLGSDMSKTTGLMALDQGTTSSRAIVFDRKAEKIALHQKEFPQHFPKQGWVEHDPDDIWATTLETAQKAFQEAQAKGCEVVAIGITNQRETTIIWDRETGQPIYNAIVWQDRRTADICRAMKADGVEKTLHERTGLLLDPYFSMTKIGWILDHVEGARARAEKGDLAFGTVDSFLLWKLTGGKKHKTDVTNAARTGLMSLETLEWDEELLRLFKIPRALLPQIMDCADDFGETDPSLFGRALPIAALAGDQQAASIGQCCFIPGMIKSTYGTGCFVLMNTGDSPKWSQNRLLTTVAYRMQGQVAYALEGSIFIAGAAVQWLRDGLGIIKSAAQTQALAANLADNQGVYMVPAFTGLGAPHWDPDARGGIFGITRDTGPQHLARAALESVCYQTHDLLAAMEADGLSPKSIRVDGGMVANDWVMQFLSDILGIEVERPVVSETTALGAAYLAGLHMGLYESPADIARNWARDARFSPKMPAQTRKALVAGWEDAVARVKTI